MKTEVHFEIPAKFKDCSVFHWQRKLITLQNNFTFIGLKQFAIFSIFVHLFVFFLVFYYYYFVLVKFLLSFSRLIYFLAVKSKFFILDKNQN